MDTEEERMTEQPPAFPWMVTWEDEHGTIRMNSRVRTEREARGMASNSTTWVARVWQEQTEEKA